MSFLVTNTSNGPRVICDVGKRQVTIRPGETKRVNLDEAFAERMQYRNGSLKIVSQPPEPPSETRSRKAAHELADRIDSGELSLYLGRKQAVEYMDSDGNVPTVKGKLVEALRAL